MPAPLRLGFLTHPHGTAEPRQLYRDYVELFVAAEAYLAAYPGPADRVRIGLSRGVYPATDKRTAKAIIEAPVLRMAERMIKAGRFPAGLSPEEYFERMHISYGSPDEVAERLAGDRVLPLATDLIVQFSPAAPPPAAAITALELLATRVAPALGSKPAAVDVWGRPA